MASPTTPMHGKWANLYCFRPNGFKGSGLNDLTWGTNYDAVDSGYFEVVIDAAGTPDTFKWRKDGGAWTEDVAITGAAQTLSDSQTITFAATTGHTLNDQWAMGNLVAEATTENGTEAQITDSTKRLLNPNKPPTWTDTGGKNVLTVDYVRGKAVFDGAVTVVTVTGDLSHVVEGALQNVGYLLGWDLSLSVELAEIQASGDKWKSYVAGYGGGSGSADAYFIAGQSALDAITEAVTAGGEQFFLLELFNYDPDQDQTGDHFLCWATITGIREGARLNQVVQETINFQVHGYVAFTSNA